MEMYLRKGARLLSEEMETVFTTLLIFGGRMKWAMRNMKKSVG